MSKLPIADLASEIVEMEVAYMNEYTPYDLEKYYREHRFDDLVNQSLEDVQYLYNRLKDPE